MSVLLSLKRTALYFGDYRIADDSHDLFRRSITPTASENRLGFLFGDCAAKSKSRGFIFAAVMIL